MLHIVLVDTALELIPQSVKKHPSVRNNIEKYGSAAKLFDTTWHHSLLAKQPDHEKRGRPDILHHFLLDCLGSPANQSDQLRIHFHTTTSGWYTVKSDMRCPRDYLRFKSLMAQLLRKGSIPPHPPYLIQKEPKSFGEWIKQTFTNENSYLFSLDGKENDLEEIVATFQAQNADCLVMIGGFQKGEFSTEIQKIPCQHLTLPGGSYDSWVVVQRVLVAYELAFKIIKKENR